MNKIRRFCNSTGLWMRKHAIPLTLAVILVWSGALRLYHISSVTNVDEPNIVKRAVAVADGQWHVYWYNWPGQSLMRLNGAVFRVAHEIRGLTNTEHGGTVTEAFTLNPDFFYTLSHLLTVLFAVFTVYAVFRIGVLLRSPSTGLLAAAIIGVGYLHTLHSRFATPDVPVTAMMVANLWIALELWKTKRPQRAYALVLLAGAFSGFALATKYTGVLAAVPVGVVVLLKCAERYHQQRDWKTAALWLLRMIGCFLVTMVIVHTLFNPFAWADREMIYNSIVFESQSSRSGLDWGGREHVFWLNLHYYLSGLMSWSGSALTVIAYITIFVSLFHARSPRWRQIAFVSGFFLLILLSLSFLRLHWSRWAVPLTPLIALAAAVGLLDGYQRFNRHIAVRFRSLALVSVLILICFPQLLLSVVRGYQYGLPSTYDRLAEEVNTHVVPGGRIIADTYKLPSTPERSVTQQPRELYNALPQTYREKGYTHVVVKRSRYHYAKKQPETYDNILLFFEDLKTHGQLLSTVGPTGDPLLKHKRDWGVYRWLWKNRMNADALQSTLTKQKFDLYAL